jgi:hypothetical protein
MKSNMCIKEKRFQYLAALMATFLIICLPLQGNGESVDSLPGAAVSTSYTYIISYETVYYLSGPQQSMPPEGKFKVGQRVRLLQDAGSYSLVESEDGIIAYVSSDSFKEKAVPPVVPVALLLKSIKEGNSALLQSVYSKRMKDDFAKEDEFKGDWKKILKYYSKVLHESGFGDYRLEDFNLSYTGSATKGEVLFAFKGKNSGKLSVINEGGIWKIDEQ